MGHEGAATRDYFAAVGTILGPAWAFTHRRRRPPPDPVNALLSFGYTLLARDAVAACELAGLDPGVGFLHEIHCGRPSLALDLIEEFRPVIVDHLVIRLCTSGKVSPAGFTTDENGRTGCRMDRDTLHTFLAAYENRMLTLAHHPNAGRRYLITYDIADDDRRTAISDLLAGHGARVQYSVFEVTLPTKKDIQRLRGQLRKRIDRDEDQIRLYPLPGPVLNELVILGNRRIEERADFWIL